MQVSDHGGDCCGITHVHEFGSKGPDDLVTQNAKITMKDRLKGIIERIEGRRPGGIIEVVLNEEQNDRGWAKALADLDFKMVASVRNNNSGNFIFMYVRVGEYRDEGDDDDYYDD